MYIASADLVACQRHSSRRTVMSNSEGHLARFDCAPEFDASNTPPCLQMCSLEIGLLSELSFASGKHTVQGDGVR